MTDPLTVLREIVEQMPECVAVLDLESRMLYANPAAERLLGRTAAEMARHSLWDLFPETVGDAVYAAFQRIISGGPDEIFDHYYPPLDRWYSVRLARVGDRIHAVARNVTEDRRRKRRLEVQARISSALGAGEPGQGSVTGAIARLLTESLDAECSLALLSADGAWLELEAQDERDPRISEVTRTVQRWPATSGHPGQALTTRSIVLVQSDEIREAAKAIEDPARREVVERYQPASLLVAPLLVGDEALGVLMVVRRRGERPLTGDDRTLVSEIAPAVGLYLAHAQRQAEATSLRHRLAAITDSNPDLIAFVDPDCRYQYVNAAYERWFGQPREALLGKRIEEVLGPLVWSTIEPHARRALSGEEVRFRSVVDHPSGHGHFDCRYAPIFDADGAVEGFASLVVDVTADVLLGEAEQRRREQQHRSTRRLESLLAVTSRLAGADSASEIARVVVDEVVDALDATMSGMWLLSPDGRSLALVRQRGFSPAQAEGFERVALDDGGPAAECIATRRPVWIASRADYAGRYPALEAGWRPESAPPLAFALVPLVIEGKATGCISFIFHDEERLSPDERTFLEILGTHVSEALRRSRLYAELRDESEKRQAMIQASPAATLLLDAQGAVHAWNPAAQRIFGWTADEVLGSFLPAVGEDMRQEFLDSVAYILAGNVVGGRETRRVRKSGDGFDVELYAAPVRLSDGRTLCLSVAVDISERKRIERGRQLIVEANAVLTRSLDGEQALEHFVQLPLRDFCDLCLVDLLGPEGELQRVAVSRDEDESRQPLPRRLGHEARFGGSSGAIATRQPQILIELDEAAMRRVARDEEHLAAMLALRPRASLSVPLLVGDRLLGALSFVSKQRNFDNVDVVIATELASHVATAIENARLYREARAARGEAEAASRAKDEFLAILGHELRNPLAPIGTALQLMQLRGPDQLQRERAVIERQMEHLTRLVDDLLDVSRITRGKIELRRERVPLATIVTRAIELTSPLLEVRHPTLTVDIPPSLEVYGDPTRLSQVVANLVSNAAKYTRVGGNIEIRAAVLRGQGEDGHTLLAVRDDGLGLAPEMLSSIFEIFVQAPQSSARTNGGLGLGLAIVKSLVELHGGTVFARSEGLGMGSEFVVTLPPVPLGAPERHRPLLSRLPRPTVIRRILVVDDNEDAASLLGDALSAQGHQTRTAFDGPSALRIALEFRPDVAVLDIGLPVMDGYELAQRLRQGLLSPELRLIAVTGYGQEADRARALASGFDEHLTKPVRLEKLLKLVSELS